MGGGGGPPEGGGPPKEANERNRGNIQLNNPIQEIRQTQVIKDRILFTALKKGIT